MITVYDVPTPKAAPALKVRSSVISPCSSRTGGCPGSVASTCCLETASAVSTMTATQNMTVSAQIRRARNWTGSAVIGHLRNRPPSGGAPGRERRADPGRAGGQVGGDLGRLLLQRLEREPHRGFQLRVMPRGPVVG